MNDNDSGHKISCASGAGRACDCPFHLNEKPVWPPIRIGRLEVYWDTPFRPWRRSAWEFYIWPRCLFGCRIVDVGPFNFTWLTRRCIAKTEPADDEPST